MLTIAAGSPRALGAIAASTFSRSRRIRTFAGQLSAESIAYGAQLVSDGVITPRIAATFPMAEVAKAHEFAETSKAFGRVVITVG